MPERRFWKPVEGSPVQAELVTAQWMSIRSYVFAFEAEGAVAKNPDLFAQRIADISARFGPPVHLHGVFVAGHGYYTTRAIDVSKARPEDWYHTEYTTEQPLAAFKWSKYLEDFIVSNFEVIFRGKLKLYADPQQNMTGQQFETGVGVIDILALEPATNSFVVIELKKGGGSDKVVGQILKYMGWVDENLCEEGQSIRGVDMIANDQELKVTLERIARFQEQVAHLRRVETNPQNYHGAVSGFLAEIDRMQLEAREYLSIHPAEVTSTSTS